MLAGTLFYRYRRAKTSSRAQREGGGQIATRISEVMTTVPLVQAFGREKHEEERFEAESAEHLQESMQRPHRSRRDPRRTVIGALGTAAVVFFGAMQVFGGALTPGDLLIFTSYTQSMFKPVAIWPSSRPGSPKLRSEPRASPRSSRSSPRSRTGPTPSKPRRSRRGLLRGRLLRLRQRQARRRAKGRLVYRKPRTAGGAGGASGAGKSTLISLILRLYEPREGAIFVDGIDIRDYKRRSLGARSG